LEEINISHHILCIQQGKLLGSPGQQVQQAELVVPTNERVSRY